MAVLARIALILLLGAWAATAGANGTGPFLATRDYPHVFQHAVGPDLESGYALAQDGDGFIWLGTQSGVVRWDGHRARARGRFYYLRPRRRR